MIAEEEIAAKSSQMHDRVRLTPDHGCLISSVSESLLINPPRRAAGLPSLNKIKVGIELTEYSAANSGLRSVLTFTILTPDAS